MVRDPRVTSAKRATVQGEVYADDGYACADAGDDAPMLTINAC